MSAYTSHIKHGHNPSAHQTYAVVVNHSHLASGILAARSIVLGIFISGLVVAANHLARPYSSAQSNQAPIITQPTNISAPIQDNNTPAAVQLPKPVKPSQTNSDALQAIVKRWQKDYSASTFGVVIRELSGSQRSASINASIQFQQASLYKLYLEQYLYNKIDSGQLNLNSTLGSSRTLRSCLELMITISDNQCGESIGYNIGWVTLNNAAHANGFTQTTLSPYNATTAHDIADYLEQLQNGSLINKTFSLQLLANMRRQIFRSGIPAGVPSVPVADKVGIKTIYWHDAAIVYHPKGTYILVVLTKNSGTAAISDLSRRISDFMNL